MKRIIFRLMLLMTCLLSLVCCSQENVPDPYHPGLIKPPLPSIDDRHHSAYFGNAEYDFEFLKHIETSADCKYKLQGFLFPSTYEFYNTTYTPLMIGLIVAVVVCYCLLGGGKRIEKTF